LRSAVTNRLTVPLSTFGSRAFSISSPQTWNQLAEEVTSAKSLSISSNVTSKHSYLENHSGSLLQIDTLVDWWYLNYLGHSKKILLEALMIDYHEDSPMTKEEKLRWELLGFVKKVGLSLE